MMQQPPSRWRAARRHAVIAFPVLMFTWIVVAYVLWGGSWEVWISLAAAIALLAWYLLPRRDERNGGQRS